MLSFENDYSSTAAPEILKRMQETADEQNPGYGDDDYCKAAAAKIGKYCDDPSVQVVFLTGGTQTNQVVLDAITPPYAGVVAADSGHVAVHEAGAIESTGHKVLTIPAHYGKIRAADLDDFCERFYADANHEHMVAPGSVYISQPTEYGTVYSREELAAIAEVAHSHHMPLFIDGARLGYALTAVSNDNCDETETPDTPDDPAEPTEPTTMATMADIARICDVFTIGGTKCGAMIGEAVVFTKHNLPSHFTTLVKRHGALLAKGWLLGLQFDTLFTDDLYFNLCRHANEEADRIREVLVRKGYNVAFISSTNQIFITVPNATATALQKNVRLGFMEQVDAGHVMLRICTSWATTDAQVDQLIKLL
ncbi:threonine aldolase family protein [Bifidobacterium choloepi]|uniref:Aminotransferase class I/II-fold pyridoxal phosphate-dependent enzyme n=1 Tax=Bifidobacterium choloepi TaxID=2614131 RepID=A0A6I5MZY6_9BIFI|nr:aminotransferase class I/II-fold pyridoxal phosphate-dependent enzyme [Bifidobacterium choloepi]NEG69415.1 aminotransferase class I/II-fold pyridoxal phosphate-dependent enzyme [Bifidobacterium choloepi]